MRLDNYTFELFISHAKFEGATLCVRIVGLWTRWRALTQTSLSTSCPVCHQASSCFSTTSRVFPASCSVDYYVMLLCWRGCDTITTENSTNTCAWTLSNQTLNLVIIGLWLADFPWS